MSVSVIIPTLSDNPVTLDSVPDGVEIKIVSKGSRSEARNLGAIRASGEVLVFCDDDIRFDEEFFWDQIANTPPGTVSGLSDFTFGLLLTRFFVINGDEFEKIGRFDERLNHKEDTEFCLRAIDNGLTIRTIPRQRVEHIDHEPVGKGIVPEFRSTVYLFRKYPWAIKLLFSGYLTRISEVGILRAMKNAGGIY